MEFTKRSLEAYDAKWREIMRYETATDPEAVKRGFEMLDRLAQQVGSAYFSDTGCNGSLYQYREMVDPLRPNGAEETLIREAVKNYVPGPVVPCAYCKTDPAKPGSKWCIECAEEIRAEQCATEQENRLGLNDRS